MALSIPDRWLNYKAYGKPIKNTKILPLKVPLKEAISQHVEPEERFTPAMLLEAFPHLKYIIDLTNTYRYYDRNEFIEAGVRYEKVMIPGHKVPAFEYVKRFFHVMDDFTSTSETGDLIGIHCTHGVNRTGYLICRYLIQQLGWEMEEAIKGFDEARGHAIEREAYVSALKTVARGEKIDTSSMRRAARSGLRESRLGPEPGRERERERERGRGPSPPPTLAGKRVPFEMGLPPMGPPPIRLPPPPRRMLHQGPFPPQQFPFARLRPGFGPMPPPLPPPPPPPPSRPAGMPPITPPPPHLLPPPSFSSSSSATPPPPHPLPSRPPMFGPKGRWFEPRLRPPMPPPLRVRPYPARNLPIRQAPVMDIPANNTGAVISTRLPLPSRPPHPSRVPFYNSTRQTKRKSDAINGNHSDRDFTADTFEENLREGRSDSTRYKRRLRRSPTHPRIDTHHSSRSDTKPSKRR